VAFSGLEGDWAFGTRSGQTVNTTPGLESGHPPLLFDLRTLNMPVWWRYEF